MIGVVVGENCPFTRMFRTSSVEAISTKRYNDTPVHPIAVVHAKNGYAIYPNLNRSTMLTNRA